eukprot:CAMPEP_0171067366 /NCGR_PEP_ID=MMETSP0766_2-20121228/7960_1 /TAXON_ID=439317 /ORGANISM="Gambierdiscus australes, Strain CAWD 149" /LENGTH=167 /DNA_ID=CAMNT_0011523603 /DNA_START=242 /DNA_END=746 /DNA_ORIENTATION=+
MHHWHHSLRCEALRAKAPPLTLPALYEKPEELQHPGARARREQAAREELQEQCPSGGASSGNGPLPFSRALPSSASSVLTGASPKTALNLAAQNVSSPTSRFRICAEAPKKAPQSSKLRNTAAGKRCGSSSCHGSGVAAGRCGAGSQAGNLGWKSKGGSETAQTLRR